MHLNVATHTWPLREPFTISRGTKTDCEVVVVHLQSDAHIGRGEAMGVNYHGETPETLCAQIEAIRPAVENGVSRRDLLDLLPAGGARNALDAALWDLEAKQTGRTVWELANVAPAHPVVTNVTIGIRSLAAYEARARELVHHPWIKIKVDAHDPIAAVRAVRRAAPAARLVVDANQAWSMAQLLQFAAPLAALNVDLLEQPVAAEHDEQLTTLDLPIPVCADEPANTVADLPRLIGRYDFVNIKLDKCGGLTAGLQFAQAARAAGLRLMVGCMAGGSLAMAPAMVLAQLCEIADLDGPLLQIGDWPHAIAYHEGVMSLPSPALWG